MLLTVQKGASVGQPKTPTTNARRCAIERTMATTRVRHLRRTAVFVRSSLMGDAPDEKTKDDAARGARRATRARASADFEATSEEGSDGGVEAMMASVKRVFAKAWPTIELGGLFAGWYYFSIAFNVYQKALLKAAPIPLTVTFAELALGSAMCALAWVGGLKKAPEMKKTMVKPLLTLGAAHMLGNALTNVSLGKVAVSFTHTIKALEPVFSVGLSAVFLGNIPSLAMVASLVPIIGGVAIASATEVSFNLAGFVSAMGSNLAFQSRNVLSKFVMTGEDMKKLDYINLFSGITIASTALALPLALMFEIPKMNVAYIASSGVPLAVTAKNLLLASLCFQLYQQLSFMVLSKVTPVTHSVGNSLKRVVVIAASVVIFRNPVSATNIAGTAMAIAGVILYGQCKKTKSE
jgi:solute carrier family 35 protein E1